MSSFSSLNLHSIARAEVSHFAPGVDIGAFSTVKLTDEGGFSVNLFVTPDQALAIAAVFAPQVNEAGVPVFEGRAA
jgi:hypothetical protein